MMKTCLLLFASVLCVTCNVEAGWFSGKKKEPLPPAPAALQSQITEGANVRVRPPMEQEEYEQWEAFRAMVIGSRHKADPHVLRALHETEKYYLKSRIWDMGSYGLVALTNLAIEYFEWGEYESSRQILEVVVKESEPGSSEWSQGLIWRAIQYIVDREYEDAALALCIVRASGCSEERFASAADFAHRPRSRTVREKDSHESRWQTAVR